MPLGVDSVQWIVSMYHRLPGMEEFRQTLGSFEHGTHFVEFRFPPDTHATNAWVSDIGSDQSVAATVSVELLGSHRCRVVFWVHSDS